MCQLPRKDMHTQLLLNLLPEIALVCDEEVQLGLMREDDIEVVVAEENRQLAWPQVLQHVAGVGHNRHMHMWACIEQLTGAIVAGCCDQAQTKVEHLDKTERASGGLATAKRKAVLGTHK